MALSRYISRILDFDFHIMSVVRVLGSRAAGKTTYLTALASFAKKQANFSVTPINDEAKKLANWAENILEQGGRLTPTDAEKSPNELPSYLFLIEGKQRFQKQRIDLSIRDYSGEIFEKMAQDSILDQKTQSHINSCLNKDITGCLIILTAWEKSEDNKYRKALDYFTRTMEIRKRDQNLRLALVMGKCERGEIWPGRIEPETDLFDLYLPSTKKLLEARIPSKNLGFFAVSAFGVLGKNDPRPNRIDEYGKEGTHAVLRDPELWQPYNLLAPIFWAGRL